MDARREMEGLDGLVTPPLSRRGIVMTGLIAGYTLATTRVEAQAVKTDSTGLVAEEIKIPVSDGELPGYRAMPQGAGPFPIVIVVEEVFGVHEYIKDTCRRLAKLGYCAVAPEIYARQGDLSKMTDIQEIIRTVVSKKPDAEMLSDFDATVKWAATSSKGDQGRLGVTGFCRGGRATWLYAAHNPSLKAAVAWYGALGGAKTELQPRPAGEVASEIKCPLLGLYGGKDPGIPVADVEKVRDAARGAGKTVEIVIYPESGHAFHADYRPSYREADAKDGWEKLQAWFKKYGVA